MKKSFGFPARRLAPWLLAAGVLCALASAPARAQSEASAVLSLLPVASVVGTASVASTAAGAVAAVPVALSVGGAVLTENFVANDCQPVYSGPVRYCKDAFDSLTAFRELKETGTLRRAAPPAAPSLKATGN